MKIDNVGQHIFDEKDICDLYMIDHTRTLKKVLTSDQIKFDPVLNIQNIPELIEYRLSDKEVDQFDQEHSSNWFMPEEYKSFDIAKWVLQQCKTDEELQRAGEELMLFQERDMFVLLQYMKFLVDTMRRHNIVWGVGRGSSISSFVLYLIGIHRVNSLYYDLSIDEFLK